MQQGNWTKIDWNSRAAAAPLRRSVDSSEALRLRSNHWLVILASGPHDVLEIFRQRVCASKW